ncbi:MAG: LytTR family transcriptional regulator [Chitinophagaceae bacterium]|nr:LytTR family transcriptional regulator [Chitinophagaceae bacterium]
MREFSFKTSKGLLTCNERNIIKITSISNYSKIFFDDNTTLVIARVLKWFEAIVTPGQFIRVNQSVLINTDYIKIIDLKNKLVVSDHNNETFRISKSRMINLKDNPLSMQQPV